MHLGIDEVAGDVARETSILEVESLTWPRAIETSQVRNMPVVRVDMWEGRTEEVKEKLIKGITEVFTEIGVSPEWVTVIINDVPKRNWGSGGKQASKMTK